MTPKPSSSKIENYFDRDDKWREIKLKLREIIVNCGLTEEYKWYKPCYNVGGDNILLIHGFKDYFAILFLKGVLLTDSQGILVSQTENVQSARQMRFSSLQQVVESEPIIKQYIHEAIETEKSGL